MLVYWDVMKETQRTDMITITMLYNNISFDPNLTTGWGLACLIEGLEKTILLDTGDNGQILLSNMDKLKKDPAAVDILVLSHAHGDHTGGLTDFLGAAGSVTLWVPESFPDDFKKGVVEAAYELISVDKAAEITNGLWTTGQMGTLIKEQALVLSTPKGLAVITGCAHPGIVNMVEKAKQICSDEIYLALGGFHLMRDSSDRVEHVIDELKNLGVKKNAPSHCTGKRPVDMFRQAWKEDFMDFGCGATVFIE